MQSRTVIVPTPALYRAGAGPQDMIKNQGNVTEVLQKTTPDLNNVNSSPLDIEMTSTTASNLYRDFNTAATTTELNTPEIRTEASINSFDESFLSLLEEPLNETDDIQFIIDQGNNTGILMENTLFNESNNVMSNSLPLMEEVWSSETFDNETFGPCLSAAEVEGVSLAPENVNKTNDEELLDFIPDIENKDLLQWIIDDQNLEMPFEAELSEAKAPEFFIEIKDEKSTPLNDEEKYRKMRDQNNEASRRCRQNRKRKLAEVEKEAEELERRNKQLRVQLEEMEAEVALWKRKLLTDISYKNKRHF